MISRFTVFAFLASATVFANASFDLILVTQNNGSAPRVLRFDGTSGAYFGSFGDGILPATNVIQPMAVDSSKGIAYVANYTPTGGALRLFSFNYSTGALLNDVLIGSTGGNFASGLTLLPSGQLLVFRSNSTVSRVDPNTGAILATGSFQSGATYYSGGYTSSGWGYAEDFSRHELIFFNPQSMAFGGVVPLAVQSADTFQMNSNGSRLAIPDSGDKVIRWYQPGSNGAPGAETTQSTGTFAPTGAAFGHGNQLYVLGTTSTSTTGILRISNSGGIGGVISNAELKETYGNLVVVTAPEPGSLAAWIAGGLAGFILRRRSRQARA